MRRCVIAVIATVAAAAAMALPSAASGAALVPLAPSSAWPSDPIHATAPPGDPRLFVAERGGGVRIFENGALRAAPFLTVPNVDVSGERGLLSIAFAPDYASSGLLYVFTVAKAAGEFGAEPGDLQVVEYKRSALDPSLADPGSARLVLEIPHTAGNHNGGQLAFGPDGLLYVTVGDNAIQANAQDKTNLYGKVLRIDPRGFANDGEYGVPPSNPFVGAGGGTREEIFALGLRNPYRASFAPDRRLVVPDVGSSTWEEVNLGNLAGANLGWPICEGACAPPQPGLTDPIFQYANADSPLETTGCAIIGGHVVRDQPLGELLGRYLYGDACRSDLRTIDLGAAGGQPRPAGLTIPSGSLLGFGEDSGCGLYVLTTGTAYRVAMSPSSSPSSGAPACGIVDPVGKADRLRLTVRAARRQRLRGHVKVVAICSQACALRARGRLHFFKRGRKAGSARLIPVSRPAKAGARNRFRLAVLKVRVRQRAKRLLKQGGRVSAQVTVVAFDGAGDRVSRTVHVRLKR